MGDMINAYNILVGQSEGKKLDVDGKMKLEWMLGKWGGKVWIGFIWLRIISNGGLLWTQQLNLGFHYRRGISRLAE
jgi:hypothetical protein